MNGLVPLLVVLPLGAAFLVPLAGRGRRGAIWIGNLAFLALLGIALLLSGTELIYHVGAWPTPQGIDLRVDGLTTLMLLIVNGLALIAGISSIAFLKGAGYRYYGLLLFLVAGMNGVVLTGDLFNLYVFMEIAAIASYALVAFQGEHEDLEASFKYAILGGVSSALILVGITLLYGVTGTLNMGHIASRFAEAGVTGPARFAFALFFCGFGLKAAIVPFHAWLPDAYPAAPAPVSAIFAGIVSKAIGLYVLARLVFNVFGAEADILLLLRWAGGVTMVAGGFLAVAQWDIKRLFACSSISQMGLILLALGFGTVGGVVGAIFHLLNHAVFKPLLFLNCGEVERVAGTRDLRKMGGLRRQLPITSTTSLVASLSLVGIPPFCGFWSKLIIVIAGIQAGHPGFAVAVVLMSVVALVYQFKAQKEAFHSAGDGDPSAGGRERWLTAVPMLVLAAGCLLLGLLALGGLDSPYLVGPAADALMGGRWGP